MQAYEGVPSEPKERHPILRLGRRRVHQELLQSIEQSRLQQEDLTRKLTRLAEDMGEQVDRLSGAADALTHPRSAEPTAEEQLGRLFLRLMHEGFFQRIWFHKTLANHVTEDTAEGVRLAAQTVLDAPRETPLPEWAVRAFTRLAEDPLHARERPATDQSSP